MFIAKSARCAASWSAAPGSTISTGVLARADENNLDQRRGPVALPVGCSGAVAWAASRCSLAPGLIATRADGAKPRITPVEVVAFAFSIFTVYGCGPEPVLFGLLLLLLGIPVYVWQRRENAAVGVALARAL